MPGGGILINDVFAVYDKFGIFNPMFFDTFFAVVFLQTAVRRCDDLSYSFREHP